MDILQLNTIALDLQNEDTAIHVFYWGYLEKHYTHELHKHSFFECCYITSGSGYYIDNGVRYDLHEGDSFLSKPGIWHQIEGDSEVGIGIAYLAFELLEERSSKEVINGYHRLLKTEHVVVKAETPSTMVSLWKTILNTGHNGVANRQMLKHMAFTLIFSIFELFLDKDDVVDIASIRTNESMILNQAKLYIVDNVSIRIKFQDLAKHLHISVRQLSRLFKDELGETFSEYYRKTKINVATTLLETSNYSLAQIAELTGFYSIHHFTKAYKQATGYTPGQWRKMAGWNKTRV